MEAPETASYLAVSLAAVPNYLAFLATMLVLLVVFTGLHNWVTPYRELTLIKQGNKAAAVSLVGVVLGFAVALGEIASGTHTLIDLALWGAVALATQLLVYFLVSRLIGDFHKGIEEDRLAYGITLGGCQLAAGVLNAGALTS